MPHVILKRLLAFVLFSMLFSSALMLPTFANALHQVNTQESIGAALDGSIVTIRPHGYFCEANVNHDGLFQGSEVHLYSVGTTSKQQLQSVGDDCYSISAMKNFEEDRYASYSVWDINGRSKKSGAVVHVWGNKRDASIPDSRKWRFVQNDDKTYYIINKNSGLYLALGGTGADEDGTQLIQSSEPVAWDVDILSSPLLEAMDLGTHAQALSWMQGISDNTKLSDITMPGAHDAGTCSTFGKISPQVSFTECQQLYPDELLQAGVRFLDLRLGSGVGEDNDPNINHGNIPCLDHDSSVLTFSKCVAYAKTFLKFHNSETVVMMVSHSGGSTDVQTDALYTSIQNNPNLFYTDAAVPTMGQVRGKIVLIRRFEPTGSHASSSQYGLDLSAWGNYDSEFKKTVGLLKIYEDNREEAWVQDYYGTTASTKLDYVVSSFYDAQRVHTEAASRNRNTYVLNYTSCTKYNPFSAARTMNSSLYNNNIFNDSSGHFLGIVVMDFVNARQAEQIWQQNFK